MTLFKFSVQLRNMALILFISDWKSKYTFEDSSFLGRYAHSLGEDFPTFRSSRLSFETSGIFRRKTHPVITENFNFQRH